MTQILVEALIHVCGALVCILAVYNAMRFQSSVILIGIPLSVGIMLQVRWSYSQQVVGPVMLLIDLALILGSLAVVLVVTRQAGRVDELRSTVDIRGTAYALMAEEQPGMVCRFKPDGTLLYVNGAYARYFDLPPEKLVGTNFLRLVPESEHSTVLEHLQEVSNGLSRPLAHEVITSDGKLRWVEWTDQPVFDHRGQLVEFQATGFDVTDRRNANLLLMRSARQKAVVGELGQMSLGGIQTQELLERSMHEIAELCGVQYCGYFELQPDEDTLVLRAGAGWQPDYIGQLRMQLSENEQARYTINTQQTVVVHNPDKETRFAQCRMHYDPSMNCILSIRIASENRVHGLISLHSHEYGREFDIDDLHFIRSVASVIAHTLGRRTTEEELRLSESRFRTLVENMPILFCAFDENLNVVYWNKECERVTGISS
ncbi:MAG: PAS domain S-box protein, partial [Leptospiraceae bacterium]|nr:PAS domain S-box protein [Leptospiraceae bacterium]